MSNKMSKRDHSKSRSVPTTAMNQMLKNDNSNQSDTIPGVASQSTDTNHSSQMQSIPRYMNGITDYDYSNESHSITSYSQHLINGKKSSFPFKLFRILSNPEFSDVITWLPHGCSWKCLDIKSCEENVLPNFFRHSKFSSFMRQVTGWGFKRVTKGPDQNSYYHKYFRRDMPQLLVKIKRPTSASDDPYSHVDLHLQHPHSNNEVDISAHTPNTVAAAFGSPGASTLSTRPFNNYLSEVQTGANSLINSCNIASSINTARNLIDSSESNQLNSIRQKRDDLVRQIQAIDAQVSMNLLSSSLLQPPTSAGMQLLPSFSNQYHNPLTTRLAPSLLSGQVPPNSYLLNSLGSTALSQSHLNNLTTNGISSMVGGTPFATSFNNNIGMNSLGQGPSLNNHLNNPLSDIMSSQHGLIQNRRQSNESKNNLKSPQQRKRH